jgi:cytochrome c553
MLRYALTAISTVIVCASTVPEPARSEEAFSSSEQRGLVFVRTNCSRCHSVDKVSKSSLPMAPPFRTLHERYPVRGFNFPAHRNLRVSEGVENLLR